MSVTSIYVDLDRGVVADSWGSRPLQRQPTLDELVRAVGPGSTVWLDPSSTEDGGICQPHRYGWHAHRVDGGVVVSATVRSVTWDRVPVVDRALRTSPHALCWVSDLWATQMGAPWQGTPGMAGLALLSGLRIKHRTRSGPPSPEPREYSEVPLTRRTWERETGGVGVVVDSNRRYLAAMSTAPLARDVPVETGPQPFVPTRSGWWLIDVPEGVTSPDLPPPTPARGRSWVTTPTMTLLQEILGEAPRVLDSRTAPGARVLRPVAERLEDGWQHVQDAIRRGMPGSKGYAAGIKATYRELYGMLGRSRSPVYRPDWHHTITAQARSSMWRAAARAHRDHGVAPVYVDTDAIAYGPEVTRDSLPDTYRLGGRLGEWKIAAR